MLFLRDVVRNGGRKLAKIIHALRLSSRLSRVLNRGHEKRDQDADNRNDDQELDQCESVWLAFMRKRTRIYITCVVHEWYLSKRKEAYFSPALLVELIIHAMEKIDLQGQAIRVLPL